MKYYSQHGEDLYISEVLIMQRGVNITNTFIEIGACDGKHMSNCRHFYTDLGFVGLCVEPNMEWFDKLVVNTKNYNVSTLMAAVGDRNGFTFLGGHKDNDNKKISESGQECPIVKFENIVEYVPKKQIGVLSIDAEGFDTIIVKDAIEFNPECIIIESNTMEERKKQINILNNNYHLCQIYNVNTIWLRNDLVNWCE